MTENEIVQMVGVINTTTKMNNDLRSTFEANPDEFFRSVFSGAGYELPDGFHAHGLADGEELPLEPEFADIPRSIYVFRTSGEIDHFDVQPTGGPSATAAASGGICNNCGLCIVILF